MTSPDWLTRYRLGQREHVWHELRQLGDRVRHPDFIDEARAVCDEMARRARHNVEILVHRLTAEGYRFHTNDDAREPVVPHYAPTADALAYADWLEARFGPLPLTLDAWVRIVGDVWLVGTHPEWPDCAGADPLVVEVEGTRFGSFREYFADEHDAWRDCSVEQPGEAGVFRLPLAPDALHKDNVSGGPPYGMPLPDACADGLFGAETVEPFVGYLNRVFRAGGFPAASSSSEAWRVRRRLAKDLLPL